MPDASPDKAIAVIDRIRADFAALPHAHGSGVLHASFSAGIACLDHFSTAESLTTAADNALLEAKRKGRNCVVNACEQRA